jgi:hypothetical protein
MVASSLDLEKLPVRLTHKIVNEMGSDETIQWFTTPLEKDFSGRGILLALMGFFWTGISFLLTLFFLVFAIVSTEFSSTLWGGTIFSALFILVGVGLIFSPLWLKLKARGTAYVITSQRALICQTFFSNSVRTYLPAQLQNLQRNVRPDGSGDLIFERFMSQELNDPSSTDFGFLGIADVQNAELLIRELINQN